MAMINDNATIHTGLRNAVTMGAMHNVFSLLDSIDVAARAFGWEPGEEAEDALLGAGLPQGQVNEILHAWDRHVWVNRRMKDAQDSTLVEVCPPVSRASREIQIAERAKYEATVSVAKMLARVSGETYRVWANRAERDYLASVRCPGPQWVLAA
jgi:hypothetical protein